MPEFTYEAMANTGTRSKGTLTAGNEREVMAMLDSRGLFPVRIEAARSSSRGFGVSGRRIRGRAMCTFYSQLADLLHSGVPLLRSLEILERQSSQPALAEVLREVKSQVSDGTSLADAMNQHPRAFNELAVSMVRAGQEGGFLEDVLKRIATFTEHQEDLKSKVVGALAYPIFLSVMGFLVVTALIVFFVPKFETIFSRLAEKGQLPVPTIMLMAISHFVGSLKGLVILVAVIGVVLLLRHWARSEAGRVIVDGWRLKIPVAGNIYLSFALSRFTRILGTLLHNGIPILNALKIAKDSTGNRVLTDAINRAAENIRSGDKLATPLSACKYFPRDVVEMIAVGEESNSLETVLVDIAEGLEKRTTRQLDLFVRLLEPIMLMVMAAIILFVVAGLLLPIFRMGNTIQ